MSESTTGRRKPRTRRNPCGELLHLLNMRYHREWVRAEALQRKLARFERLKVCRLIEWLCRLGRRLRPRAAELKAALTERAVPFIPHAEREDYCSPHAPREERAGRVSIVIPFRDRPELVRNCLRSLTASTYRRFEVILVDNGSAQRQTHRLLSRAAARRGVSVVAAPEPFNFSRLCNLGAERASGDYLLFLNNDTEVLDRDWLERLLDVAGDPRVGVAGATLLYPDRTIQHAGLFQRGDGVWVHPYRGCPEDEPGDAGELRDARAVPAVTAACLLVRRELFQALGGFDERLAVMHNDVDLCARVRQRGLLVVVTPRARLFHYESLSRGYMLDELRPGH